MIDGPVQQNGQTVMVAFGTHAQAAATAMPQVSASAPGGAPSFCHPPEGTNAVGRLARLGRSGESIVDGGHGAVAHDGARSKPV